MRLVDSLAHDWPLEMADELDPFLWRAPAYRLSLRPDDFTDRTVVGRGRQVPLLPCFLGASSSRLRQVRETSPILARCVCPRWLGTRSRISKQEICSWSTGLRVRFQKGLGTISAVSVAVSVALCKRWGQSGAQLPSVRGLLSQGSEATSKHTLRASATWPTFLPRLSWLTLELAPFTTATKV